MKPLRLSPPVRGVHTWRIDDFLCYALSPPVRGGPDDTASLGMVKKPYPHLCRVDGTRDLILGKEIALSPLCRDDRQHPFISASWALHPGLCVAVENW